MFNKKLALLMSLFCVVTVLTGCDKKKETTEVSVEEKNAEVVGDEAAVKESSEEDALAKAIENVESSESAAESNIPEIPAVPALEETKAA